MPVDFVAVGHMTQDRIGGSFRPGGAVSYAAVAAYRLGRRPGILTRACLPGVSSHEAGTVTLETAGTAYGALSGIPVRVLPSGVSTVFQNIYDGSGRRVQAIKSLAGQIAPEELPADWALAPVFLLGPVAGELPVAWAAAVSPGVLMGVVAQGWLRAWDQAGLIRATRWESSQRFLERCRRGHLQLGRRERRRGIYCRARRGSPPAGGHGGACRLHRLSGRGRPPGGAPARGTKLTPPVPAISLRLLS